jgi:hypothetical protein
VESLKTVAIAVVVCVATVTAIAVPLGAYDKGYGDGMRDFLKANNDAIHKVELHWFAQMVRRFCEDYPAQCGDDFLRSLGLTREFQPRQDGEGR